MPRIRDVVVGRRLIIALWVMLLEVHSQFISEPQDYDQVLRGSKLTLPCVYNASATVANWSWVTKHGDIGISENTTVSDNGFYTFDGNLEENDFSLVINTVDVNQLRLRCVVNEEKSRFAQINVIAPPYNNPECKIDPFPLGVSQTATLSCTSKGGLPAATLRWQFTSDLTVILEGSTPNNIVDSNGRQSSSLNGPYTFTRGHNGKTVECVAENAATTQTGDTFRCVIKLNITFKPGSAGVGPAQREVEEGEPVALKCTTQYRGNPSTIFHWNYPRGSRNDTSGQLIIPKVKVEDDGSYTCTPWNTLGSALSAKTVLTVWSPPKVVYSPQNTTVLYDDDSLVMTCTYKSRPSVETIHWLWTNGSEISGSVLRTTNTSKPLNRYFEITTGSLTWGTSAVEERKRFSGSVYCATTFKGKLQPTRKSEIARLNIQYPPELNLTVPTNLTMNSTIAVKCEADSNPPSNIFLFFESEPVGETLHDTSVTTTLLHGPCHDGAIVLCRATNGVGSMERNTTLRVECPPGKSLTDGWEIAGGVVGALLLAALVSLVVIFVIRKGTWIREKLKLKKGKKYTAGNGQGEPTEFQVIQDNGGGSNPYVDDPGDSTIASARSSHLYENTEFKRKQEEPVYAKPDPVYTNAHMKPSAYQTLLRSGATQQPADVIYEDLGGSSTECTSKDLTSRATMCAESFFVVMIAQSISINNLSEGTFTVVKTTKEEAPEMVSKMLLAEIKALKEVGKHDNLVHLLAHSCNTEPLMAVLRVEENGSLEDYLLMCQTGNYANLVSCSQKHLVGFAHDVAQGMTFLCGLQRKILHRQLSTSHALVGKDLVCRITGFGFEEDVLAREEYEKESRIDRPPHWQALEQIQNGRHTTASDVWAFGILLFEVITAGEKPYARKTNKEICKFIKAGKIMSRPASCTVEIYRLMVNCWKRDSKERTTFKNLEKELGRIKNSYKDWKPRRS